MKIVVIGAGALGKAYGGLLALAGHEVHFLVRSEYAAIKKANKFSLHFKETNRNYEISNPHIHADAKDLPPADLILLAVKTTSNDAIGSLLEKCRTDRSIVVVLQNGIGNEEWVSQFTGASPILCCISMMGAVRKNDLEVAIPILGMLKLAPYKKEHTDALESVRDAFQKTPIAMPILFENSHKALRWFKLTWNVPFGALSLMYDKTTSVLASEEPYRTIVEAIIAEIKAIALADGVQIPEEMIAELLGATRRNEGYFPSTYVDFKQGRRIEKEYLFDNVLKIAERTKTKTPVLHVIERYLSLLTGISGERAQNR